MHRDRTRLRSFWTTILGATLQLVAFSALAHRVHSPDVPILMYHHVGDWGPSRDDWAPWVVKPKDFEAQLDWLRTHDYHTITLHQLIAHREHDAPLPEKPVVLTFDDGWGEDLGIARQYLEPRGMKGVFFVYTGAVVGSPYLSWSEVKALDSEGHEIESHTISHPDLRTLNDESLAREMRESKATLERELGHPVEAIAYPFGLDDPRVDHAAEDAGYHLGLLADGTNATDSSPRFRIPRWKMSYDDSLEALLIRL